MFGEVFDRPAKAFTSHYTTQTRCRPCSTSRSRTPRGISPSRSQPADAACSSFFKDDDWYTDADSNVYQLPTFLGNHDMGRIGHFLQTDNPGAGDTELVARDRLAHELMYFSRGNPVIYYGDEQGFTGDGGDQVARQTMFASQVPEYLDDDLLGTDATHAQANFDRRTRSTRTISELAQLNEGHPALRNGAQQNRYSADGPGSTRSRASTEGPARVRRRAEQQRAAEDGQHPDLRRRSGFRLVYGDGAVDSRRTDAGPPGRHRSGAVSGRLRVGRSVPEVQGGSVDLTRQRRRRGGIPQPDAGLGKVGGSSFYEVTFYAKTGNGAWTSIGTDDSAPYQVFHDVSALSSGTNVQYRAVVLDNAGTPRPAGVAARRAGTDPDDRGPAEGGNVRGTVEVRAIADPERADPRRDLRAASPVALGPRSGPTLLPGLHGFRRPPR